MLETPKILGVITDTLSLSKDFYILLKALLVLHSRIFYCVAICFMAYLLAIIGHKTIK
jgi:hypothetical protein